MNFRFWGIFWIDGSSRHTVERAYEDVSATCGLNQNMQQTMRWLSNKEDPWLLIIDNADDPSLDISSYFPAGNRGTILLTTRNPDCEIHATVGSFRSEKLLVNDAVELLLKVAAIKDLSETSRHSALRVAETLGFLALALVQAGAFIRQKSCSLEEYCDEYSRQRQELLDYRPVQGRSDYPYTVHTTLEVSITKIKSMPSPVADIALCLLHCFSFWHFEGIPGEYFKKAWLSERIPISERLNETTPISYSMRSVKDNPSLFQQAIVLLTSFSLISVARAGGPISVHPLVHTCARDRLKDDERLSFWAFAIRTLVLILDSEDSSFRMVLFMERSRSLLPHIKSCVESSESRYWNPETFISVDSLSDLYSSHACWEGMAYLKHMWLDTRKSVLGDGHDDFLCAMRSLASVCDVLGLQQKALELSEQVLGMRKMKLHNEHPDVLESMSDVVQHLPPDRSQEAIKLSEGILEVQRRNLGNDGAATLKSMDRLAHSYWNTGLEQDALELYSQVLRVREKDLGVEHLDTLMSLNNVAHCYYSFGKYQDALKLFERAVEHGKILDADTLFILLVRYRSACCRYDLGQKQEAIQQVEQILSSCKEMLGEKHRYTLRSAETLAKWKSAQERDSSGFHDVLQIARISIEEPPQSSNSGTEVLSTTERRRNRRLINKIEKAKSSKKRSRSRT